MDEKSEKYLSGYIKVTEKIKKSINRHINRYNLSGNVCAWYSDWEDFCSDWCDECGYTKTEARALFHGGKGEFMTLPDNNGIIRFEI